MTKRTAAKYKIDRRMGENIWGRAKSPVNRREYGPGQHGQRRKGKLSDFGTQLRAKQKLKGYYGDVTEKQFRGIYDAAVRKTVNAVFTAQKYDLIERAAQVVCDAILENYPKVQSVKVELKKPEAPINAVFDYVSVEMTRSRA